VSSHVATCRRVVPMWPNCGQANKETTTFSDPASHLSHPHEITDSQQRQWENEQQEDSLPRPSETTKDFQRSFNRLSSAATSGLRDARRPRSMSRA
jgi:hypothetical protein